MRKSLDCNVFPIPLEGSVVLWDILQGSTHTFYFRKYDGDIHHHILDDIKNIKYMRKFS